MNPEQAAQLAERFAREDEVDQLLIDLLRAPSEQTDQLEFEPRLKGFVAEFVAPRIESLTGIRISLDPMGNLLWRHGGYGNAGRAGFLWMGYAMTFPAGSMADPFSGAIVDGERWGVEGPCVIGRGACEQKGPLAAMIAAAAILTRTGVSLKSPVSLAVCLAGETGRHDAARFIIDHNRLKSSYGIVGLGTQNSICLGNKGRIDVEIHVAGKSAHSSMPWQGVNAIEGARRVMELLEHVSLGESHPELGEPTLTMTGIKSSPEISHTLPDHCRMMLDRRLLPGDEPDEALEAIESALRPLKAKAWRIEVKRGAIMYPSEVARDCAVASALAHSVQTLTGRLAKYFYSPAALDAGFLNRHGIQSLMFGPGDLRLAHTDHDLVSLSAVRNAAKIYAATALQLCA